MSALTKIAVDGIAKSAAMQRRAAAAGRIAAAMASGNCDRARAEADLAANPAATMAMSFLVLRQRYGHAAEQRALQGLAVHV